MQTNSRDPVEVNWEIKFVRLVVMEMLRKKGFSKVEEHALSILSDLILSMIKKLMNHTKELSHLSSRAESNVQDLLTTFKKFGIRVDTLIDFIKEKKQRSRKKILAHDIMDVLTRQEQFGTREGMGSLNRSTKYAQFEKVKIRAAYPIKFSRDDLEKDFKLSLEKPPELTYKDTKSKPKKELESAHIKDLKAEEKRIFEIENCNISAIAEGKKIEDTKTNEK